MEILEFIKNTDTSKAFNEKMELLKEIVISYSYKDVIESLFISDMWLLNITSFFKHSIIYATIFSEKAENYSNTNKINNFADFKEFIEKISNAVPDLFLDDYIPDLDWGDIKYLHNNKIYKIFYSSPLSYTYDHIEFFKMVYSPFETSESGPIQDLENSLRMQDYIISNLPNAELTEDSLSEISPGHIECPGEVFWLNARKFYNGLNLKEMFSIEFLEKYSFDPKKVSLIKPQNIRFEDFFAEGSIGKPFLPFLFIKNNNGYYPVLPRQGINILFNYWKDKFPKLFSEFKPKQEVYQWKFMANFINYIKDRINIDRDLEFVSIYEDYKNKPDKYIIPVVLKIRKKLIFIFLTNPFVHKREAEKQFNILEAKMNKIKKILEKGTIRFYLNHKRMAADLLERDVQASFILVLPRLSTSIETYSVPINFPGKMFFLDQFLGIIDEIKNIKELNNFLEFNDENKDVILPLNNNLDKFSSFKFSEGLLVEGAIEPTAISFDPQLGDQLRYKTLKKFWGIFPEIYCFENPRAWNINRDKNGSIHFDSRGFPNHSIYFKVSEKPIFISSPFEKMGIDQVQVTSVFMESIDDSFAIFRNLIENHNYFKNTSDLGITVIPLSLVGTERNLGHLKHLKSNDKLWEAEAKAVDENFDGFRLVFNDKLLIEKLAQTKDRSLEVEIFIDILSHLNSIRPDDNFPEIIKEIAKFKTEKQRNGLFEFEKEVSFPQHSHIVVPKAVHYKKARKFIAKSALTIGLQEGDYTFIEAKEKINALKILIIEEINTAVKNYSFKDSIPYLIAKIDSLTNDHEMAKIKIKHSLQNEIEFSPEEEMAKIVTDYIRYHKEYRYLIEKFVQLSPVGNKILDKEGLRELLALVNWLIVFQEASDGLHYNLIPGTVHINSQYLVEVIYEDDLSEKQRSFEEENQKIVLGIVSNDEDRIGSGDPVPYLEALDKAFCLDLGFSLRFLINALMIFTNWPIESQTNEEKECYSATYQEIEKVYMDLIVGITPEQIKNIIDFLTLKKEEVLRLIGFEFEAPDIPIWEHNKRHMRYILRPLILIDGLYYFGAHSANGASKIWAGNPAEGSLPYNIPGENIGKVLREGKKRIEDGLVLKTFEVVKRFTSYIKSEFELYKLPPKNFHKIDIGDYDVFAFYPEKNILLNIECKDILPAYSLKDADSLREKIFGPKKNNHIKHIKIRQEYLENHWEDILTKLGWPFAPANPPKIIPVYVARKMYWCMRFPPEQVNVNFLRIDMLEHFIKNL